ncbi:MAG: nitroreductase [Actinotalea sp.]|nr:nitroreductase [Actinotalea sp.]
MEFEEAVRRRRMVRRYSPRPVPADAVDRALLTAVRAPSAGFTQGWAFLVLDQPADVARFWEATTPPERARHPDPWLIGMRAAPVVVVPMSSREAYLTRYAEADKAQPPERGERWSVPYWHLDTAMASLLILLAAVDQGLGSCFFGIPPDREQELRQAFAVPLEFSPIGAITLGYEAEGGTPRGSPSSRGRRPIEDVVHRGRWHA